MKQAIINLINKWGCMHQWKLEIERNVVDGEGTLLFTKYTYTCTKCGKFKKVKSS